MEKPGSEPRIQIGSATDAQVSAPARLGVYTLDERSMPRGQPVYVTSATEEGCLITHVGVLCSAPLPNPSEVPLTSRDRI